MSTSMNATAVPLLFHAIENTDIGTLKYVLKSMCGTSTECYASAARFLLIQKGQAAMDDDKDDDEEEDDDEEREHKDEDEEGEAKESCSAKRKKLNHDFTGVDAKLISRYETCAVCKKRFDLTMNNRKACRLHTGDLEIDDDNVDGWADDDDYMYARGEIDPYTNFRREDFPDLFKWNCCDGNAKEEPCHVSRHVIK